MHWQATLEKGLCRNGNMLYVGLMETDGTRQRLAMCCCAQSRYMECAALKMWTLAKCAHIISLDSACALLQVMVTKNRLPLVYDKSRPARFGVIPKRPKSGKEVRWFELDPGQPHAALCSPMVYECGITAILRVGHDVSTARLQQGCH